MNRINIAYIVKEGQKELFKVSLKSLMENMSREREYHISVFAAYDLSGVWDGTSSNIEMIILQNDEQVNIFEAARSLTGKVVFVSPYVVFNGDVAVYSDSLCDSKLAVAARASVSVMGEVKSYISSKLGMVPEEYIADELVAIDVDKLKKEDELEKFCSMCNDEEYVSAQSDVLNLMLNGKVEILGREALSVPGRGVEKPIAVSFRYCGKPWQHRNAEYSELFWKYAKGNVELADCNGIKQVAEKYKDYFGMRVETANFVAGYAV